MVNEDFDIEKYRIEYPIDYLKALELILTSSNEDDVFKTIYQITRLHIPNTLFKYFSLNEDIDLNELKFKTLSNQSIYLADIKTLNDPFDTKALFFKSEHLLKHEELNRCKGKIFDDISSFSKISSFTSIGINCMPMWAHYSNNHQGFCVSYDMKETHNAKLSSCMFPIQYSDKRIDITPFIDTQLEQILSKKRQCMSIGQKEILITDLSLVYIISLLSNIKHTSWSYENEFRCTAGALAENSTFMPASPKEIYIGKNCSNANAKKLTSIATKLNTPIYKMSFNDYNTNYNLTPTLIR